jgi:hypothetical protein
MTDKKKESPKEQQRRERLERMVKNLEKARGDNDIGSVEWRRMNRLGTK